MDTVHLRSLFTVRISAFLVIVRNVHIRWENSRVICVPTSVSALSRERVD